MVAFDLYFPGTFFPYLCVYVVRIALPSGSSYKGFQSFTVANNETTKYYSYLFMLGRADTT